MLDYAATTTDMAREGGCGNAGLQQCFGCSRSRPGAGPGGQGCIDRTLCVEALAEIERGHA